VGWGTLFHPSWSLWRVVGVFPRFLRTTGVCELVNGCVWGKKIWNTLFYAAWSRWGLVGGFSRGLRVTGFVTWWRSVCGDSVFPKDFFLTHFFF
jgi:hypothetical protein